MENHETPDYEERNIATKMTDAIQQSLSYDSVMMVMASENIPIDPQISPGLYMNFWWLAKRGDSGAGSQEDQVGRRTERTREAMVVGFSCWFPFVCKKYETPWHIDLN